MNGSTLTKALWETLSERGKLSSRELAGILKLRNSSAATAILKHMAKLKTPWPVRRAASGKPGPGGATVWEALPANTDHKVYVRRK